ncbi:aspartate/glutamate racemase family protein [Bradyrhizobium sp. SEMIA]|uniref:aspartate/glutamate racemase family protein n=1 Tax=Bradyrhizobium sp. SEMIA TaxID=2597515 RepID=UPI0018A51B82|nr:aspartate/glutamate racemase family protein [Bradyrhizobium sp. SEMIA]QOG21096.1 hypothetical protein FOM02_31065 [Bradyrhizobium sp. SEMIA]
MANPQVTRPGGATALGSGDTLPTLPIEALHKKTGLAEAMRNLCALPDASEEKEPKCELSFPDDFADGMHGEEASPAKLLAQTATSNAERFVMESGSLKGGQNVYGHRIGILMIETHIPRPPGAIGNASSFAFPVLHHVVKGTSGNGTVRDLGALDAESTEFRQAIEPWIDGARYLEHQGCHAITTSCGFSVLFQHHLLEAVSIPVFSSSLMLIPFIVATLQRERRVGVITADAASLSARHLLAAHIDPKRIHVVGMDGCPEFAATAWDNKTTLDFHRIRNEVVTVAKRLVDEAPDTGALLLECALLPPYAAAIQAEIDLPVFDFTHLVSLVHNACARNTFSGLI